MKIEMITYSCENCACTFDAPALDENVYGEFLLWSQSGQVAYLNALEDKTYKEVDNLLGYSQKIIGLRPVQRADILGRVYGRVACDPDDSGLPFEIDAFPPCPKCDDQKISSWTSKNPPEIIDATIPAVTHHRWDLLTSSEKQSLVDAAL